MILSFSLLVSLMLLAQIIFNLFFVEDVYLSNKCNAMEDLFQVVKSDYDGSVDTIETIVYPYEEQHNMNILIEQDTNLIYASYHRYLDGNITNSPMPKLRPDMQIERKYYSENPVTTISMPKPNDMSSLCLLGTFQYNNEEVLITIFLPMASIESSVDVFTRSSTVISLVVLLIGIIISIILSKSITKPISEMEQVASHLEQLDFSNHVNENVSSSELHSLAKSINSMSTQLETSVLDLNHANETLKSDIDSQKQVEDMRRQFVANVSHEMKTPLALLQMYASNLKLNIETLDKEYYLDTIIEETEILNDMVISMLQISAIESGLSAMQFEMFSMSDLCDTVIAKTGLLLESFALQTSIQSDIFILGDKKYLEQAMVNFITNAADHTQNGDVVCISLSKAGESMIFSVFNQGSHIEKSEIPHIWDTFYRSDKARVRESKNVGLGLHIVKIIVEKHNGACYANNYKNGVLFEMSI